MADRLMAYAPMRDGTNQGTGKPRRAAVRASAACGARRRPPSAECHGSPSAAATRAAITVGRSPTARTPSIGRRLRRFEDRRHRRVLVVKPDRDRPVPPRIVDAHDTDPSRTRAPPQAVRPPRQTRASDTPSSSPIAGRVASCTAVHRQCTRHRSPECTLVSRSHIGTRLKPERPAPDSAPLNSTKARSGTARSPDRAPACGDTARDARRASCASVADLGEHRTAIGGQPRADDARDVALQRVDARIGMRPAVRQRRRIECSRRWRRISSSSSSRDPSGTSRRIAS